MFFLIFPPLFLIIAIASIYRYFFIPKRDFKILSKINHCVIGHRAAPIIIKDESNQPTVSTPPPTTTTNDHTKGVFDANGWIIPENTIESFKLSYKSGIRTFELDVQLTKDGQCVVFHDQIIGKTLVCAKEEENFGINKFTFEQLKAMPFRTTTIIPPTLRPDTPQVSPYTTSRVTLLKDILIFCKGNDTNVMIEVKPQANLYQCCVGISDIVQETSMFDNIYVASFSPLVGIYLTYINPLICFAYLFTYNATTTLKLEWQRQNIPIPFIFKSSLMCSLIDNIFVYLAHPYILWLFGTSIVIPQYGYISKAIVEWYKEKWNIMVICWTVNERKARDYLFNEVGVSIITDHPDLDMVQIGSDQQKAK